MILTLTANPSLDRTAVLPTPLSRGAVHRLESVSMQAAGKGVNISRAAVAAGVATLAVLPALEQDPYVAELVAHGIPVRPVLPAGNVRINLSITEPDGTTTKLNSPGDTVGPDDLRRLADVLLEQAAACTADDWVVLAGSVPPGTPADWYADLVGELRATPPRVAVDTSDAPLRALVDGLPGSAPHLIKPNGEELATVTGSTRRVDSDPVAAAEVARELVASGIERVLVTLGGHGAVLVDAEGAWHAFAPPVDVVSTVGAGDSSLFGYLLGHDRDLPPEGRLALAVAYGRAAVTLHGTTIPDPSHVDADVVEVRALSHA
ncbi:1-phosphofructokinase family hexose kinase [Nocardioides aequoreus]|uniref:1-phosphofructokinase family hexose kinase n=1 Tax=Nocardioides aequoreus TaxID=397278 RepID=UPI0004C454E6|nr:1-phosphofructokinase family hexose kinase [Nocardioides aequoreus]